MFVNSGGNIGRNHELANDQEQEQADGEQGEQEQLQRGAGKKVGGKAKRTLAPDNVKRSRTVHRMTEMTRRPPGKPGRCKFACSLIVIFLRNVRYLSSWGPCKEARPRQFSPVGDPMALLMVLALEVFGRLWTYFSRQKNPILIGTTASSVLNS